MSGVSMCAPSRAGETRRAGDEDAVGDGGGDRKVGARLPAARPRNLRVDDAGRDKERGGPRRTATGEKQCPRSLLLRDAEGIGRLLVAGIGGLEEDPAP